MEQNESWSKISNELSDITKKVKDKLDGDDLIDDLKDTLKNTFTNTNELLKKILYNLETTINDEEIKSESIELINRISTELKSFGNSTEELLGNFLSYKNYEEE